MRRPQVQVLLGELEAVPADIVVVPSKRPGSRGRVVHVGAPRWRLPDGPVHLLAQAYRQAVQEANARAARSMAMPGMLSLGPWPLDDVIRVGLTVLLSTPTSLQHVTVVARTPAMLERWAEGLAREEWGRAARP